MQDAIETVIRHAQHCLETVPAIILGTGSSIPYGIPGMEGLKNYLISNLQVHYGDDVKAWNIIQEALKAGKDIENALKETPASSALLELIVKHTWKLVQKKDCALFNQLIMHPSSLELTRLYEFLFQSTHRVISVITTNYDRAAEYAADCGNFCHSTGFSHGFMRTWADGLPWQLFREGKIARTVEIWKVHGSLDWFSNNSQAVLALAWLRDELPAELNPLIVTPGLTKYQETLKEPFRSVLTGADNALQKAKGYFCIGYGFNDEHIFPKLINGITRQNKPIVVVTKHLTPAARKALIDGTPQRFLAIEEDGVGSKVYFPEERNGVSIGIPIWNLKTFIDEVVSKVEVKNVDF